MSRVMPRFTGQSKHQKPQLKNANESKVENWEEDPRAKCTTDGAIAKEAQRFPVRRMCLDTLVLTHMLVNLFSHFSCYQTTTTTTVLISICLPIFVLLHAEPLANTNPSVILTANPVPALNKRHHGAIFENRTKKIDICFFFYRFISINMTH